jgi:type II secretory pathway component PulF
MITYNFEAKNSQGKMVTGTLVAVDQHAAEKILNQNDLEKVTLVSRENKLDFSMLRRVSIRDKAIFSRQLSTMLSSGFPILQSLSVIILQTENETFKTAIGQMISELEEGHSFSSALSKHPKIFSQVFVNVVRAGETSGKLAEVLLKLADTTEKDYDFSNKVRGALLYPLFLVGAMIVIGVIMMVKVIPSLESVFTESGATLPWTTRAIVAISHFIIGYWYVLIILILGIIVFCYFYFRTEQGKRQWDLFKLRVPVFNGLIKTIYMTRFASTLGLLVKSGIPILEAIRISADAMNHSIYEDELKQVRVEVEKGISISAAMSKSSYFLPMVSQMIGVGEKTGNLDEVLESLAKFYTNESDTQIKSLVSLIEPVLIIIIGIGIAIMVFSIIVPIYNLAQLY